MLWFTPKLPISDVSRTWVDSSMDRLIQLFGHETLDQVTVVLPTEEFFPDDWDGTDIALEPLFQRVCKYMGVDRARIDLVVFENEDNEREDAIANLLPEVRWSHNGPAGLYHAAESEDGFVIRIDRAKLTNLTATIAILAHELGHVRLLGDGKISREEPNMEPLTDLITVFLGMGIFSANSAENFKQYSSGGRQGWSMQRLGYLPQPVFGYALAKFAELRGERKPAWTKHLVLNVREYCAQSLKVLISEKRF
jgi:hypothetical protein